MLTFTAKLSANASKKADVIIELTAEQRAKSRDRVLTTTGDLVCFKLPRGTVLKDGDLLQSEAGDAIARIVAKKEPVYTVSSDVPLNLLKAAYHLGNRHVPLEVNLNYLKLSPDPVLEKMLEGMGLKIILEEAPFQPESGVYGQSHHAE